VTAKFSTTRSIALGFFATAEFLV